MRRSPSTCRSSPKCGCTPGVDANGQPKYEAPKRPITVRDILRHTAGFHGDGSPEAVAALSTARSIARDFNNALPDVIARMATVPFAYQPGTQWKYSDAVDVQAYLVQKISGVPVRRISEAAHLPPARHDQHAPHHSAHRPGSPAARRALHAQRGRHIHAPVGRGGLRLQRRRLALQVRQFRPRLHASTTT